MLTQEQRHFCAGHDCLMVENAVTPDKLARLRAITPALPEGSRAVGAFEPTRAMILTGKAGSVTLHRTRILPGSAPNMSDRNRMILFHAIGKGEAGRSWGRTAVSMRRGDSGSGMTRRNAPSPAGR